MKGVLTLTFGVAALALGGAACAQSNDVNITIDENGHGFFSSTVSPEPTPLASGLASDPGPGGSTSALTYDLLNPPTLVSGDVLIREPGAQGGVEDIIRFNEAGSGGDATYPASLVFYSDRGDGVDSLADSSTFPIGGYTNVLTLTELGTEGNSGVFYTPTEGQPGFIADNNTTYQFVSDGALVPEPSPVAALGLGVLGMGVLALTARKRRQPAA